MEESSTEVPVKRTAKWPWLAAVLFMVGVVIAGIYASDRARSENVVASSSVTTTSSVVPTTAAPVATTVGTTSSTAVSTTAAPVAVNTECSAANLLQAVRNSGRVDESSARSIAVTQYRCASGFGYARMTSEVGPAEAYFRLNGDRYEMLVLGSAVDATEFGVPASVVSQLKD